MITPDPRSSEPPGVDAREDLGSEVQRLRTLIRDLISQNVDVPKILAALK